jgi:hypothetical protein
MHVSLNITQCTIFHHKISLCIEIHHNSSTNEFTSSITNLKSQHRRVTTHTSLCCIIAAIGSSYACVQDRVSEVISDPNTVM